MTLSETISRATGTTQPSLPQEYMARTVWKQAVLGTLNVLAMVLAVRLILLVAVAGAIWLSWLALQSSDLMRLYVLCVYCGAVVVPAVVLSWLR